MAQRLQDILGRLYRAPVDGMRQVFALSRADAERLPELPSIAIISITAPERPPAHINGCTHVLRLSFADVNFLSPDLSARAREKLPYAFKAEHRAAILSFVEALPTEISSLVVHCEGTRAQALSQLPYISSMVTKRNLDSSRRLTLQSSAR